MSGQSERACRMLCASCLVPLLLSACAVGPDFERPAAPSLTRYTREGGAESAAQANPPGQTFSQVRKIDAQWWQLFHSPELAQAVKDALERNASLQSAQASLRQSQESLQAGYGIFFPSVDVNVSAVRQRISPLRLGLNTPGSLFNLFTLSGVINYAIDAFGGERRTVEALASQTEYQRYQLLAAYLALTGNVVNTWIACAAYQAQIRATTELIARQQQQLALAKIQVASGTAPYSNVLSINAQLAATQATIPALEQKLDQAQHLLALLGGRAPSQWQAPVQELHALQLPRELPLSLPSELVRQRPDILAAEAQLHVASAQIGVATANLFPSVALGGTYGWNSATIGNLTDAQSRFWSVGPSASLPLFHGGTLWHQRQAAREAYQRSLGDYRQTVLAAFAQVADTIKAIEHDEQVFRAQTEAVQLATQALTLVQVNYQAGLVGYLDVLTADAQLHQAQLNQIQATAQRLQDTTALYLVLGGGWWNANPASSGAIGLPRRDP